MPRLITREELERQAGNDPVVRSMILRNVPLTRANWLEMAGLSEPLEAELEAEVPEPFALTETGEHPEPLVLDRPKDLTPEQLAALPEDERAEEVAAMRTAHLRRSKARRNSAGTSGRSKT